MVVIVRDVVGVPVECFQEKLSFSKAMVKNRLGCIVFVCGL